MQQIKVKKAHDYAAKPRRVGDLYIVPDDHATFLIGQGLAEAVVAKKPETEVKKPTYQTASLVPEGTTERPKRAYVRRDLTAEGEKD